VTGRGVETSKAPDSGLRKHPAHERDDDEPILDLSQEGT